MSGTFGGDFDLGGLEDLASTTKLKSTPMLLLIILTMNEFIRQTK